MKKRKIIIITLAVLSIVLIVVGVVYQFIFNTSNDNQPETNVQSTIEASTWQDIITKNKGQNHYYIDYNFQITGVSLDINGVLNFDINHITQEQLIDVNIKKNEEDPIVYHGIFDLYYNDRFYYNLDDRSTYLTVDEKNNIETIYSLMEKATNVNRETFTVPKSELQNILNQPVIRYLTGVKGDDVVTVSNDVIFHYTLDDELKILKTLSAEFTINENQTMMVSYTFQIGEDTVQ